MTDRVIVALQGGLGNQLFEYAAGVALAHRLGTDLCLDIASYDDPRTRHYALAPFDFPEAVERLDTSFWARGNWADRLHRGIARRQGWPRCGLPVFAEHTPGFDERFMRLKTPVFLDGYFQSPDYFTEVASIVRERIGAPKKLGAASVDMLCRIQNAESICMHVRRGDYVNNRTFSQFHGVCGIEYYLRALPMVSYGMASPHVFVFSDEPEWVRANMHLPCAMTVVNANAEDAAHEDLWLMSACRRFVIANSSLSWWAAWLGVASDKAAIAPRQWFANGTPEPYRLIPENWGRV